MSGVALGAAVIAGGVYFAGTQDGGPFGLWLAGVAVAWVGGVILGKSL